MISIAPDLLPIFLVLILLALFGVWYDHAVVQRMAAERIEGFAWLQVVVGVGVTVMGAAVLIGLEHALLVLACFAASGAPMIRGALLRLYQAWKQYRARAERQPDDPDGSADGTQAR